MRLIIASLAVAGSCAAAVPAYSATGTSVFTGIVGSTCIIGPTGTPGVMTNNTDAMKLSSKDPSGGIASTMALITTGGVRVSVSPTVTDLTIAPGNTEAITWSPTFAISGAHNFADGSVFRNLAGPGVDTVTVNLVGEKTGTEAFAPGAYIATVTLTCEAQ